MKAIMTVTRIVGKNTGSVSPSTDNTKGKKRLQNQALAGSTQQPVSFERHPPKENTSHHVPSPPSPLPWFSCSFLSQGPLWWAATPPRCCHPLPAVRRGLVPHPSCSLMWVSAQMLSLTGIQSRYPQGVQAIAPRRCGGCTLAGRLYSQHNSKEDHGP